MGAFRADTEQRNRRPERFPGNPPLLPEAAEEPFVHNWRPLKKRACLLMLHYADLDDARGHFAEQEGDIPLLTSSCQTSWA